jgi:hypothetical protein
MHFTAYLAHGRSHYHRVIKYHSKKKKRRDCDKTDKIYILLIDTLFNEWIEMLGRNRQPAGEYKDKSIAFYT